MSRCGGAAVPVRIRMHTEHEEGARVRSDKGAVFKHAENSVHGVQCGKEPRQCRRRQQHCR